MHIGEIKMIKLYYKGTYQGQYKTEEEARASANYIFFELHGYTPSDTIIPYGYMYVINTPKPKHPVVSSVLAKLGAL